MSVKEGKSPWGMTEEQKTCDEERQRGRENERQYGGKIGGKERGEGRDRSWHPDII